VKQNWERLAIVGGCGHVGLPLGLAFAERGVRVTLLDIDPAKVEMVNAGRMPFQERGAEAILRKVAGKTIFATLDPRCLGEVQAVITAVGTPVDRHLNPTLNDLYGGIDQMLRHVSDGTLFVLRSTIYPGVTKLAHNRIVSLGRKIPLAFCPERIAEGKALEELENLPQIVSAFDPEAMGMARDLFLLIAPSVIELDPLEAELAKLFTNSWRYLNFAISNQFFMIAKNYGLDFYKIYDALTRDYPRMKGFSRPGFAAGPCLLKDTLQLAAFCDNSFFMGHAAMLVNEGLPNVIVAELRNQGVERQCVAILGMAFKGDSDDKRESLSYRLRNLLSLYAKEVVCTDPYVTDPALVPLEIALQKADVIVLGAPHSVYRDLALPPDKKVVDIWNFWGRAERPKVQQSKSPVEQIA
jgi:UDP-N-acetyl-D-mannosaminuronic acid dehydrogenase